MPQGAGKFWSQEVPGGKSSHPPRPMPGTPLTKTEAGTHPKGTSLFSHSPGVAVWSPPSPRPPRATQTSSLRLAAGVFPPRLRREAGMGGGGRGGEGSGEGGGQGGAGGLRSQPAGGGGCTGRYISLLKRQGCQPHRKLKFLREAKGPNRHFYLGSR